MHFPYSIFQKKSKFVAQRESRKSPLRSFSLCEGYMIRGALSKNINAKFTKASLLGSKPVNTPMDPNVQLKGVDDVDFADTRSPKQVHWDAVCHFLTYLKGTVGVDILYKKHTELDIFNSSDAH
ncbi:hypothetical protein CK203_040957 [Vitis vinifera]|uniref:Uncharacterized protein n=1 Tax=Vitis vinifera TaxID=29760 RepID=A0A438BTZ5_VITVI|nr:hypothetical protein CK203_090765 [Vitis vinifera]RVW88389.1 hypothetical protein CK203_040957 [Vitis vinifera]